MNDVLPKPFTKEGMLRTLEKHLAHFKKNFVAPQGNISGFGTPAGQNTSMGLSMSHMSAPHSLKDEASPGKSPSSSWHSPITTTSPNSGAGQYGQQMPNAYNMTPTHPPAAYQQTGAPMNMARAQQQQQAPHRRVMSEMSDIGQDESANKRQRMFAPQGGYPQ